MSPSTDFVPFARPSLGVEEEAAVLEVLRSGWLTTGKVARAFEEEFASYVGVRHALAVNSATSGLHLALEALGVGPGDVVVTSPYTFTSSAAVARHLGAEVRFCDISPTDYTIDPVALSALLDREPHAKAVIPVHVGGYPCSMDEIRAAARDHGCAVIEDAAHAFPLRLDAGLAGTLGEIGVYSFYATKTITTGEGGMIVTDDDDHAARMSLMRLHGFDREVWDRYTSTKAAWRYGVAEAGFKYNLPDLLAAVGREQLKKAERFLGQRREIARRYLEAFSGDEALEMPPVHPAHAWHLFSLRIRPQLLSIGRDEFIERLTELGVGCSVHFIPLHLMKYWSERYGLKPEDFPRALDTYSRTISLPIWQGMSDVQVGRVIDAVTGLSREARGH
ncbi:MAG TPA: DegT/DnrJ/EryC1/StrS family aminotransferase [Rectinemataceae bacterium]|nr:DegT/DnrJ/EryC1/StrS family aminotransferase [Rectinemataceae bacterium]